jgi:putative SOS response-associated peptidase YedK
MCGRYSVAIDPEQLASFFNAALPATALAPRYNAAPAENLPVLLNTGERRIEVLRWGLIPAWANDSTIGNKLINARAETVDQKPSFRDAFRKRRCLVLANGFYEWQKTPHGKVPMHIALKSGDPFAFAGLWESWKSPTGEILRTFTIITTTANDVVAPIHDRMPVILKRQDEALWLNNDAQPAWRDLLVPYPAELMQAEPISGDLLRKHGS